MSRDTAEGILRRHGLDAAGLAPDELKRRWQDLARRHHPDLGGDTRAMQEINAAYSFLKPRPGGGLRDTTSQRFRGVPVWAWAGNDANGPAPDDLIHRDDYSDRNFLRKRLWEMSGLSTQEWTLWAFDGRELLPPVVAYGSEAIFPEMGRAMLHHGRRGFRWPRAVFVEPPDTRFEVLLLHADRRALEPPVALSRSGMGGVALDRAFVIDLPGCLDALAARRQP